MSPRRFAAPVAFLAPLALVMALPLSGCGGSVVAPADPPDSGPDTAAVDGGVPDVPPTETGETGPGLDVIADLATDSPKDSPPPTPKTCDAMADAVCGPATEPCCTKHGITWDKAKCRDVMYGYCSGEVDAVTAGKATYDDSYLDACAKSWVARTTACDMDWVTYIKSTFDCAQLFNGTKAAGDPCNPKLGTECKAPKGGAAYCDETAKKCRIYSIVGKGEGCNFYGSSIHYCDAGLYCDMSSSTSTCKDAKKIGAACDGPDDFSCGLGNVCKDLKCAVGLPKDAPCTAPSECASYDCKASKCTDPMVTVAGTYICGAY